MTTSTADPFPHPFHNGGGDPIVVTTTIPTGYLWDQVATAFEGGSTYWIAAIERVDRDKLTATPKYAADYPFLGGAILIRLSEDPGSSAPTPQRVDEVEGFDVVGNKRLFKQPVYRLDAEAIKRACEIMPAKYARHWRDLVNQTGDATTADVFLQCAIFGRIIFG